MGHGGGAPAAAGAAPRPRGRTGCATCAARTSTAARHRGGSIAAAHSPQERSYRRRPPASARTRSSS
eukprot:6944220-Heterocapsa_arctica.AAC.1